MFKKEREGISKVESKVVVLARRIGGSRNSLAAGRRGDRASGNLTSCRFQLIETCLA